MTGSVGILNVGAGDTKLVFTNASPDDIAHASRVVKDMLRRGFALFVEVGRNDKGPIYQRAHDFDENTLEYIIAGTPGENEEKHDKEPSTPPRRRGKAPQVRVAAARTSAVAVARTAGG